MTAAPIEVDTAPAWERLSFRTSYIVLDAALQCRVGLVPAVVEDYVDLANAGTVFPPLRVVQVDGRPFLVDGWHRYEMYRRRGVAVIDCESKTGTRRDAMLEAVRANADHGLQRTRDDRRRAVRLLLQDEEWCLLSARALAELADVSHTFVSQMRARYEVEAGEVLTQARVLEVDGEPSAAWRDLLAKAQPWDRAGIEQIRLAKGPRELAGKIQDYATDDQKKAWALRLVELGVDEWPWPGDRNEPTRYMRAKRLDCDEDLVAALKSRDCPDRAPLFKILVQLLELPRRNYGLDEFETAWAGRPGLLELLAARRAAIAEADGKRPTDPWYAARAIHAMPAEAQAIAVRDCDAKVYENLRPSELSPDVVDGAYLARAGMTRNCPDPECLGWSSPKANGGRCVKCNETPAYWLKERRRSLASAGRVLTRPGFILRVQGVSVDYRGIGLLCAIGKAGPSADDAWLRAAPKEVREAFDAWWHGAYETTVLSVDPDEIDEDDVDEDDAEAEESDVDGEE